MKSYKQTEIRTEKKYDIKQINRQKYGQKKIMTVIKTNKQTERRTEKSYASHKNK